MVQAFGSESRSNVAQNRNGEFSLAVVTAQNQIPRTRGCSWHDGISFIVL
jgi:hypothetical protein